MILVDELKIYPARPFGYDAWCHMASDIPGDAGLAELHAMAEQIGLRRAWFQNKKRLPHYDLTVSRRAKALRAGAQAVLAYELVRRCRRPIDT